MIRLTSAVSRSRARILLLAVAVLLSACTAPDQPVPTATPERITISFAAPRAERQTYTAIIADFEREHPTIHVHLLDQEEILAEIGDNDPAPGAAMRATARLADTALVSYISPEDIANKLLYDLAPLIAADAGFDRTDYFTGTLDAWSLEAAVYGLPRTIGVPLLAYNQDVWQAHGLPPPQSDWSWRELLNAAEQIADSASPAAPMYGMSLAEWALIGTLVENSASATESTGVIAADPSVLAATLQQFVALVRKGALYAPEFGAQPDAPAQLVELISTQRVALWRYDELVFDADTPPPFALGLLPMPDLPMPFGARGYDAYVISQGTQHPHEAWRWLAFVSQRAAALPGASVGILPARRSLTAQDAMWQRLDPQARTVLLAALNRPLPSIGSPVLPYDEYQQLDAAWRAVLHGQRPDEAAQTLHTQIEQARRPPPRATPDTRPFVVATPLPEVAPPGATTITFVPLVEDLDLFRPLVNAFQRANPDVFIQLKDPRLLADQMTASKLAAVADCFIPFDLPSPSAVTATLDLQPLLDADADWPRADLPPALLAPFQHSGGLYGLPYLLTPKTLGYNPRLFADAGLPPPTAQWTLADLLTTAEALTQTGGARKQYGYVEPAAHVAYVDLFLELFGASPVRPTAAGPEPNLSDPQTRAAITYYVNLVRRAAPHRSINGTDAEIRRDGADFYQIVREGRAALWINAQSAFDSGAPVGDLALAPLPLRGLHSAAVVRFDHTFAISARVSPAQGQACWRWFKAFSSSLALVPPPGPEGLRYLPARRSVVESAAFQQMAPPGALEVYQTYLEALAHAPAGAQTEYQLEPSMVWVYQAVNYALRTGEVDRALETAQRAAQADTDCLRAGIARATCAQEAAAIMGALPGE